MTDGGGLVKIDLGDFSRPVTVLIEKISDAVGGIAKPGQIVRVARAESQAEMIRAQGRMEISEMQRRGLERMVREEGKRQENIENITAKALPNVSSEAKPQDIEDDWLTHFFERSRLISDDEMQSLWAKILAGEANKPGSFSKRTVDLVATLDKVDAELFTKLCTFAWMVGGLALLVFDESHEIYTRSGINAGTLRHLDDIGLVTFNEIGKYGRDAFPKYATVFYYGRPIIIEHPNDQNRFDVGKVVLTRAGEDLASICGARPSDDFLMYVLERWQAAGCTLSCPVLRHGAQ